MARARVTILRHDIEASSWGARSAFTLLEMLAVVTLAAILAAVAAVSLAGVARNARARDAADEVANYDRLTRDWARRFGRPARLTFDLGRAAIARSTASGDPQTRPDEQAAVLYLADGFHIGRVVWRGGSASAGRASLPCSVSGQMPTYAVLITGPGGQEQWLVVAGLTGRPTAVKDAQEIEDLFTALSSDDAR